MKSVQVTTEWPYETFTNLFHILHSKVSEEIDGQDIFRCSIE